MADEIKNTMAFGDWPTPDEVLMPSPTASQNLLWEKIYELVSLDDLNREIKFVSLPLKFRNYLSSLDLADHLSALSTNFNLVPPQIQKLGRIVKLYFIKEVSLISVDNIISEELKISPQAAAEIRRALQTTFEMLGGTSGILETAGQSTPEPVPTPTSVKPADQPLIATAEAAHPASAQAPTDKPSGPAPIYRPMTPPAPQPAPIPRPTIVMPKVEPLPRPTSAPIAPRPTPVPFKVEPSRVPNFPNGNNLNK